MLVPLNRRYPVEAVVDAAGRYAATTGRRVTYEYVMIDGINDTHDDAVALTRLLRGQHAHVNLIPMNPVAHTPWGPSTAERTEGFALVLRNAEIGATVRRNRGVEIGAACGQLAADRAGAPAPAAVARRRQLLVVESAAALARHPELNVAVAVAASILTADFGNLYRVVRKLESAGVDRLHLDVMDGHFVPNITFGPDVVAAFRRLTSSAARRAPHDQRAVALRDAVPGGGVGLDHVPRRGRGAVGDPARDSRGDHRGTASAGTGDQPGHAGEGG